MLSPETTIVLITCAIEAVRRENTLIPVPSRINSSPLGLIAEDYFAYDPVLWMRMIGDYPQKAKVECLALSEWVMCQNSFYPHQCVTLNRTKVVELKAKHNWKCPKITR